MVNRLACKTVTRKIRTKPKAWHGRTVAVGYAALLSAGVMATPASAQDTSPLITPDLPPDYDRDRNVSVTERARPDYDPTGILVGSFQVFPRVDTGIGASNNVYLDDNGRRGDAYLQFTPQFTARSDWSRHQVMVRAVGSFRRYLDQTPLNQSAFDLVSQGRLDISSSGSLTGQSRISKLYESPFNGEIRSDLSVLSRYLRTTLRGSGEYTAGRVRGEVTADYTKFDFDNIDLPDGGTLNQKDRNRNMTRLVGELQYAFSPSASVYGKLSYDDTNYTTRLLNGDPNRDSTGKRVAVGLSMDLAGLLRGIVGVGYSWRDYSADIYKDVDGVSVEVQLEYFPSVLTTVTLGAERTIRDSSLSGTNAFFDNRLSLKVDHELLRNMLIGAGIDYARQDYIGSPQKNDVWQAEVQARYLVSRSISLAGNVDYGKRTSNDIAGGRSYDEIRGLISVTFQR